METDSLKRRMALAVALTTCALMLGASSSAQRPPQPVSPAFIDGDVIVRFRPGAAAASRTSALLRVGGALRRHLARFDIDHVRLPQGLSVEAAIRLLSADPNVLSAEPNYVRTIVGQAPPNDPFWLDGSLWGLERIGAKAAWDRYGEGSQNVVVAVIDSGINWTHPDLAANIWTNPGEIAGNGIDDDGNGYIDDVHGVNTITGIGDPMDDQGHGTHVAGTVGAVGNNGIGVVGVARNVKLLGCKFIGSNGSGSDIDAMECLDYVVDLKLHRGINVRVTNSSWGSFDQSTALRMAFDRAADADILNVAAAGNNSVDTDTTPFYPASYTSANIIAVAASTSDAADSPASFSNYGQTSVDLAAPGVGIQSTIGSGYSGLSGTSMASPHVAGAAALLLAHDTSRSSAFVKNAILQGVDLRPQWTTRTVSGGRLNLLNMLIAAGANASPSVSISSPSNGTIFVAPATVVINANASDFDGNVTRVDFFRNGIFIASDTVAPYSVTWQNVQPGGYTLSAVATDNADGSATSAPVSIAVLNPSALSLWPATATPTEASAPVVAALELGVKFRTDVAGDVLGVRFYKGPGNTGLHLGTLWSATGVPLATAAFTSETATGWQEVRFATPVAIAANTTYVASYHMDNGGYARDFNYFTGAGVNSGPLHAPDTASAGGNGVYATGGSAFPTYTYAGTNYWVDVVFRSGGAPDVTPPVISGVQAGNVTASGATLQWTTNEPADSQVQYGLTAGYGTQSPLDTSPVQAHAVTLTGLSADTVYHYRVASRDASGNLAQSSDFTFRTSTATATTLSLWPATATPTEASAPVVAALELGVKFRTDVSGEVLGVRFYKGPGNTGLHLGTLWSATGVPLATAAFSSETATGWQEVRFAAPVAIAANTTYVASYHMDNGGYARDFYYFTSTGVNSGPLHAPDTASAGGNGVYAIGSSAFPTYTYAGTNYWVDVVFRSDATPPVISGVQAGNVTASGATLQWTTNEAADSQVQYGLTAGYGTQSPLDTSPVQAHAVTLTGLSADTVYHYRVASRDASGNLAQSSDFTFRTSTATATTLSLWPVTATPTEASAPVVAALELGVKFRTDVSGEVLGVRFYKGPGNTGVHVGTLWSAAGVPLATAVFTSETATGWQEVRFATPVAIAANTTYVASYHMDNGGYARDFYYFTSTGVNSGPLHAPDTASVGGNGVYAIGSSAFPTYTYAGTNYWVDVVFKP